MTADIEKRLKGLVASLPGNADCALIFSPESRFCFTGFQASDGVLIAGKNGCVLLEDSRYIEAAQRCVTSCEVRLFKKLSDSLPTEMKAFGYVCAAVEAERMTLSELEKLKRALPECEFVTQGLDAAVSRIRLIKSDDEVALITLAQRCAERAFEHILGYIKPGVSEREIALELDFFMLKNGARGISFETIAVSGENSSMPHGVPSDRKIANGDFITMDFGAVIGGYHSDMTRTVAVGQVSEEQRRVYDTVLAAQNAAIDTICAGVSCKTADAAARDIISEAGFGDYFGHGTGHGVGIEIHEQPRVSPSSDEILESGNVVTVEPGIYLPGRFGVRTEDMVLVTAHGCKNLTLVPKELIVL
ncbi:MAG: aminopeptidase P family protein [Clostridiales bacterium]|jgi:Xaa-Pro aminopeptidase|nr:aminopeptidase P family protein [Clostridiales bacterium]